MCQNIYCNEAYIIGINKPSGVGIVIAGLEIVQAGFGIVVIAAITEGVDDGDIGGAGDDRTAGIGDLEHHAPGVVGIAGHYLAVSVGDGDNIPLQILEEVVGGTVVQDTAYLVCMIKLRILAFLNHVNRNSHT